ncbi:MAG: phosphoribosyltransferase family protein [Thermofilaceae archaeon]
MEVRKLSWSDVIGLALTLAEEARSDDPQAIVAVLRGGIYPALIIASRLGVERLYTVGFRKYSDDKPPQELSKKPTLVGENVPSLSGERVIIVDDVARTGSTMKAAKELLESKGAGQVKTAVLVLRSRTMVYAPDYYAIFMKDCPLFPWDQ